LCGGEKGHGD